MLKKKIFYGRRGQKLQELDIFLSTIPSSSIIDFSISQIGERDSFILVVLYETAPVVNIINVSPKDGTTSLPTGLSIFISFDAELEGVSSSHIDIYENGTAMSGYTISTSGSILELKSVLANTASTYQIILKKTLPFKNNRQLNKGYVFTLRTA